MNTRSRRKMWNQRPYNNLTIKGFLRNGNMIRRNKNTERMIDGDLLTISGIDHE